MSSYMDFEGKYDPNRNFAVTNWSEEDITVTWKSEVMAEKGLIDGPEVQHTLHAGEIKTYPQYLAYYITKNLVDREMYKIAKSATPDSKERERLEFAVANKDLRKPFEDKTMQEVIEGQESPEITAMRASIRRELIASGEIGADMSSQMNLNKDGSQPEFADVPKKNKGGRPSNAAKAAAEAAKKVAATPPVA